MPDLWRDVPEPIGGVMRICKECGMRFEDTKEKKELEQFCDHVIIHQPTPGQWTEAYKMIQEGRERAKKGLPPLNACTCSTGFCKRHDRVPDEAA